MKTKMLLFFFSSLLIYSCGNQIDEKELVGNWYVSAFEAHTPELSSALIEVAKTEAMSARYSFKEDKTCSMSSNYISNGNTGNYEFNAQTNVLKMTYPGAGDHSSEKYQLESLESHSMKWKQDMGEIGFLTMTLTKEIK